MAEDRSYICIDLKSFYASVECVERGLDPMTTKLVVADPQRCQTTICLAVSPAMKALGVANRCRVFQIPQNIDYIMAPPRMQLYIDYAAEIYAVYLKYVAKEDIHVYSIDEVFMDVTDYLDMYRMTAKELGMQIMEDIYRTVGVIATCGIGTNLYLAKVALDIMAKHAADRIGILDEASYQKHLWHHTPLTEFWRVGAGYVKRLATVGIYNMEQIAKADERLLYQLFGVDAELLIDHAWGRETTTIADIKAYKSKHTSLGSGQVLPRDYEFSEGKLIVKEMADLLSLDLVDKGLVTETVHLYVGYSNSINKPAAKGTISLNSATNSAKAIVTATESLYERIVDKNVPIRRATLTFPQVVDEAYRQYDLFTDLEEEEREHKIQMAVLDIKKKFGKNAILRGMNLEESATTRERNRQIGGHKSGE